MSSTDLSGASRLYISVVVAAGVCVVVQSLHSISRAPVDANWLVLAVLTLLSGSFTVRIPSTPRKTLSLRDVRLCGRFVVRTASRDHDRRAGHSGDIVLARPSVITSVGPIHF